MSSSPSGHKPRRAAQRGAGRDHSFGLNIRLPFEQRANEIIEGDPKLINFNYFFTRKLNFVKEIHAIALFPNDPPVIGALSQLGLGARRF